MKKEERVTSFVNAGNRMIEAGKSEKAIKHIEKGLNYYSSRIMKAINPYAACDAGLVVVALRHIANEIEKNNPGAKELVTMLEGTKGPKLTEKTKIKEANIQI